MKKVYFIFFEFILIIGILMLALFPSPILATGELSAPAASDRTYVVKKGDWILNIIRSELHITAPSEFKNAIEAIKKVNPKIKDFNKIKPGQTIMLPKDFLSSKDSSKEALGCRKYVVKKGDCILGILRHEFSIKGKDVKKITRKLIELNPNLQQLDILRPGATLCLPTKGYSKVTSQETKPVEKETPSEVINIIRQGSTTSAINLFSILKHIATQINGTIIEDGNYMIPLPPSGQATIDCSKVPAVEFDDGTTIFLDSTNNISEELKTLISSSWKNFRVININKNQDAIALLGEIVNYTKSYVFSRATKPVVVGNNPKITLNADWLITSKTGKNKTNLAIFFVQSESQLPAGPIIAYAKSHGWAIIEILDGTVVKAPTQSNNVPVPTEWHSVQDIPPEIAILNNTTPVELVSSLLSALLFTPLKDAEVKAFNQEERELKVSVKADLLVKKDQKQIIFISTQLSSKLINALRESGTEIVFLDRNEPASSIIEKTLKAVALPFSFKEFSFSSPKENQARAIISFPAFKVLRNGTFAYLINFEMAHDLYKFMYTQWKVALIKY
jgi:hypothetical protein